MSDREPIAAGTWAGHQKYECPLCGRDSLDVDLLRHHIDQAHPLPPAEDEDEDGLGRNTIIGGRVELGDLDPEAKRFLASVKTEPSPSETEPAKPRTGGGRKKTNEQQGDAGEPAPDPVKE